VAGGGMQFMLELRHQISTDVCCLAFQIRDRKVRANVRILRTEEILYKSQLWQRFNAKFDGLLSNDFDFIVSLSDQKSHRQPGERSAATAARSVPKSPPTKSRTSIGNLDSYNMLPSRLKEQIVEMLVGMKRVAPVLDANLALMAAHYGGIQAAAEGDMPYHRFSIRTKMNSEKGAFVFDTQFLVSDDGATVLVHE
jgi:hypothetical protein